MSTTVHKETTTSVSTPPIVDSTSHPSSVPSSTSTDSTGSATGGTVTEKISAGLKSVSDSLSDFDKAHHISSQFHDVTSHVSTAMHRGHPMHAISNMGTAAKIGDAERMKHQHGPLDPNAHTIASSESTGSSAEVNIEPKEHTDPHPDPAKHTTSNQTGDVIDHVKASLSHGNVLHAAKYAGAAAAIGEVEREKHERGPLPEQLVDQPEAEHVNVPAGQVHH